MFSKKIKVTYGLIIVFSFFMMSSTMIAGEGKGDQFKFEDDDLVNFVEANQEISKTRGEYSKKIAETVEESGLTMERFDQIARASEIGALDSGGFSSEEISAFNEVAPKVTELRREMRSMTQALLTEKQLSAELYREILREYRQDEKLQTYVRELLQERAR